MAANLCVFAPATSGELVLQLTDEPAHRLASEPVDQAFTEAALTRWQEFRAGVVEDLRAVARCREKPITCSEAEIRLINIIDSVFHIEGRAKLGLVNRAINLSIAYKSDAQHHDKPDVWSRAIETISSGYGDCEDFAIAKYIALRASGMNAEDLRLVVWKLTFGRMHDVLAAKLDGRWLILDNRNMVMIDETEATGINMLLSFDNEGVKQYNSPTMLAGVSVATASAKRRDSGGH
jgi:predicted transglutaminase-like cysteine proteinase